MDHFITHLRVNECIMFLESMYMDINATKNMWMLNVDKKSAYIWVIEPKINRLVTQISGLLRIIQASNDQILMSMIKIRVIPILKYKCMGCRAVLDLLSKENEQMQPIYYEQVYCDPVYHTYKPYCRFWIQDRCMYGDSCAFTHCPKQQQM